MSSGLLEWVTGVSHQEHGFGISPGVVKDNLNLLSEGRIEVKVSAHPEFNPLAPGRAGWWLRSRRCLGPAGRRRSASGL